MNKKYPFIGFGIAVFGVIGAIFLFFNLSKAPYGASGGYSSSDTAGLPLAKSAEIVELKNGDTYNLTAGFVKKKIGNGTYRMLAYNGSIPGSLIKAEQGAEVAVVFKNDTDMNTTIHSHGVRLDNAFDGVPDITQKPVRPGESFTYTIAFPDAGMYWYHPHVREDYAQELGLYGGYLVEPAERDYWNPVNRELPLFLDDILIEDDRIRLSKSEADHALMGRFGNVMLVNGEPDYRLEAKKGEIIRFYIINAANTRTFNFAVSGAVMKLVGGDGGAAEKEEWKDAVIIGPSERTVVEVLFENEGEYALLNKTPDKTYALGKVLVSADEILPSYAVAFAELRANAAAIKRIDPYRQYFDRPIDKRLALTLDMPGMMSASGGHMMPDGTMMGGSALPATGGMGMMSGVLDGGIEWEDTMHMMNETVKAGAAEWKIVDQDTGKANMDIDWSFTAGDVVKIRIANDAGSAHPMQHPVHFHGQQFLVLDRDGAPQTNLAWKDTVLVPAGEYVDILLDVSNPGEWMAHCHIAEHLEAGMMFDFRVL
ncbi:MAG: multicopper oxidase family protein [Candidatus Wildermuthbacteria bacterium]|nr:multicopper oxidase family protein [Candidatus Wildermuthbacteria bacterium]